MATIKKAQLGSLIKKGVKAVEKVAPKAEKELSIYQKMRLEKGKPLTHFNMNEQKASGALKKSIEARTNSEAAVKKMTKAQRQSKEIDDSYRKNGGTVKKAQVGGLFRKGAKQLETVAKKKAFNPAMIRKPSSSNIAKRAAKKDITKIANDERVVNKGDWANSNSNDNYVVGSTNIFTKQSNRLNKDLRKQYPGLNKGGKVAKAKDGKWIQKAVNPAHKGYCTPMTKTTCTPRRKALAKTFKAMAKKRKSK